MTEDLTASGSATNAGIDYQQRIAAWLLIALLLGKDVSNDLGGLNNDSLVQSVAFETTDAIDDLKVELLDKSKIYLQVKRSINLSTNEDSDFYKTMKQFVKQFISNKHSKDYFVLATSPDSSSKILRDLFKILESIRFNDSKYQQNPLNKSEKDTYEKYNNIVRGLFFAFTSKNITEDDFIKFSKKVFIASLDIEAGKSFENSIFTYLLDKTLVDPPLFWGLLIKNCLTYSSKRLSLNKEGLFTIVGKYLKGKNANQNDVGIIDDDIFYQSVIESTDTFASGKEVLLISAINDEPIRDDSNNSEDTEICYLVAELFRFDDDGSKRHIFIDNKCLLVGSSMAFTIVCRSATWKGMTRFLEDNIKRFEKEKPRFITAPANGIEDVEDIPHVKAYSSLCQKLLENNKTPLLCLHCGERVREKYNLLVEIDDNDLEHVVGIIHKECAREIDRIQGVIKTPFSDGYDFLKGFDGIAWSQAIVRGQAAFYALENLSSSPLRTMLWNSAYKYDSKGKYCVKVTLTDGTYRYPMSRGKVERFNQSIAIEKAEYFENLVNEAQKARDPFCYSSVTNAFGNYSTLLKVLRDQEELIECKKAEIVRYSDLIGKLYNNNLNYYAPLVFLVNAQTKASPLIGEFFVLLTDPLHLASFIENWRMSGIELGDYDVAILENDDEFDVKLQEVFGEELKVIIDPLFDKQGKIVRGVSILDQNKLFEEISAVSNQNNIETTKDALDDIVFSYQYKKKTIKIRALKAKNQKETKFGQEEYRTLEDSIEALFMINEIQSGFPAILVDEEIDAMSIFQAAEEIIVPAAIGGLQTARHSPWVDLLSQASIVLLSFPNNDAGQEASEWWLTHLPNAKLWPLPKAFANVNEMLVRGFDIREWILAGLST